MILKANNLLLMGSLKIYKADGLLKGQLIAKKICEAEYEILLTKHIC
jgi:hypothetical protein